jgi:hypothetical protein|nr:MAG TPA: hypothetical protein [Caudoviricetes sp.]
MANNTWKNYTQKSTALSDNDEVMLLDSTDEKNKRGLMSKFWDYVVDKMATAVISKLETNNKTIIGAINALNSETKKMILLPNGKTVTLVSTQDYDTIIIVGQLGGKIFFDIISLHQNAHIIHLGEITIAVNSTTKTSTIIEIPNYAICIALGSGQLSYL